MFSSLSILHIVLRWKMLGDLFFFITQVLGDHWFVQLPQFNQLRQRSCTAYGWKARQNGRASGYIIYALYGKKHSAGRYVTTAVIWVSPLYACGSLSFQRPTLPLVLSHFFPSNTWVSFTRYELKLESVHQESPRSDIFRKRATKHFWNRNNVRSILPGLRRKITGLLLSGPKSSFQMKVNFAFHLEIKVPESGGRVKRNRIHVAWSPVRTFHSQWWFGLPCHLLVLVHCVFWSPQSMQPSTRTF